MQPSKQWRMFEPFIMIQQLHETDERIGWYRQVVIFSKVLFVDQINDLYEA